MDADHPSPRRVRRALLGTARGLCESVERAGIPGVTDLAGETFHALRAVRSNRESRDRLAEWVSQLITALKDAEKPNDTGDSLYPTLNSLDQLKRVLEATSREVTRILRMNLLSQYLRYNSIQHALDEHSDRVEKALTLFHTEQITQMGTAFGELKSSAVAVRKDNLRRVRRFEVQLFGRYEQTGWELVEVGGLEYLGKRYGSVNDPKFEIDRAAYTRLMHFGLPQISGVCEEYSMLLFQYPKRFETPSGSQITPEGLVDELVSRKDFWRLRTVAARMYYDIEDALCYLRDQGVHPVKAFDLSQLAMSKNGRFIFIDGDLRISSRSEQVPHPKSGSHDLVADLFGSILSTDDLFMKKLEMILCRLESQPRDDFRSLPASLSKILKPNEPTFAFCDDGGLSSFRDNYSTTSLSSQYLPGDVLHVPDHFLRLGTSPRKLCNVVARFGRNYDQPYSTGHSFTGQWKPQSLERGPSPWKIPSDMTPELLEPDRPFWDVLSDTAAESTNPFRFDLEIPEHLVSKTSDLAQLFWNTLPNGNVIDGGTLSDQPEAGSFVGYLVRDLGSGEYGVTYQQSMFHNDPKIYSDYRNVLPQLAREFGFDQDQLVLVSKVTSYVGISVDCETEQPRQDLHLYISLDGAHIPHWTIGTIPPERTVLLDNVGATQTWQGGGYSITHTMEYSDVEVLHFEQDESSVISWSGVPLVCDRVEQCRSGLPPTGGLMRRPTTEEVVSFT